MNRSPDLLLLIGLFLGGAITQGAFAQSRQSDDSGASVEVRSFPSHSRLSFRLDEGTDPKLTATADGFQLFLSGVGLSDLGAPLGEESHWAARFASTHDPRLASLQFREHDGGTEVSGKWKFSHAKGSGVVSQRMEYFDYRDKASSRYLIDFWIKEGPSASQIEQARRKSEDDRKQKEAEAGAKTRADRRLASDRAKAKAEDFGRFCREPMTASNDVFLRFLPVHEKVNFGRWIPTTTPDSDFAYYQPTGKTEEAEYVRLALALYQEGKAALVIRTLDFFDRDFPRSSFSGEMKFLRANALLKLGLKDESDHLLAEIVSGSGGSPAALHAAMYLAARQMDQDRHLAALESFLWLIRNYPDHRLIWLFHLGAAEALLGIKQTDRAAKEYEWVAEYAPDGKSRAEGSLREGDLYLQRFQYDQALAAYFHGLHYFKDESREFPTAYLNRAESLYWLEQYDRAEEAFTEFLTLFPAHPEGWRAAIRIGEIHARTDKEQPSTEARRWYSDAINRFPLSPGATLARLRLMPCLDHGGFDAAGAERFFEGEAMAFSQTDATRAAIELAPYRALRALTYIRSMAALGHEEAAITAGIDELHGSGIAEVRGTIGQMLEVMFRKRVIALLDQHDEHKTLEALELYRTVGSRIQHTVIVDPDYLLKLSIAVSDLGLGKQGKELADTYRKTLDSPSEIRGPASSGAQFEERVKTSEKDFAEAKALWVEAQGAAAAPSLAKVKELLVGVTEESPFFVDAEIMLGLIAEREGDYAQALRHAARAQLTPSSPPDNGEGGDGKQGAPDSQLEAWVAGLQARAGDKQVALSLYRNLENHLSLATAAETPSRPWLGVAMVPSLEQVVYAEATILEEANRWREAADAYARLTSAKLGGNHALFGYARALLNLPGTRDRNKGLTTLEAIAKGSSGKPRSPSSVNNLSVDDDFWRKMAGEKLATERNLNADASNAKEGVKQ